MPYNGPAVDPVDVVGLAVVGTPVSTIASVFNRHVVHIRRILRQAGTDTPRQRQTQERYNEVKRLRDSGMGIRRIGKKLGMTHTSIADVLKKDCQVRKRE